MNSETELIVSIKFTDDARQHLGLAYGPTKSYQGAADLELLRHAAIGDFVQIEGIAHTWVVLYRTLKLMSDQSELFVTLDGPIEEGG